MLKLMHTGDLHLGREYQKQKVEAPAVAQRYQEARKEALENVVRLAEQEQCDVLVVAGDVFDSHSVPVSLVRETADLLAGCVCPVVVLPGNHDYCEGPEDKLWKNFREYAGENTMLLTEAKPVTVGNMVFYPCPCTDRYAEGNALDWVKALGDRASDQIHIGLAHGALEGLSFDREKRYYYMTRQELEAAGMDLWLLGHTHVPYPNAAEIRDQRIFNAGTPQQTDVADNAEGTAFVIEVGEDKHVKARRLHTGVLSFVRRDVVLRHGDSLAEALDRAGEGLPKDVTTLRLTLSGVALAEEYQDRKALYDRAADGYLKLEIDDDDLRQEITEEMIDRETLDGTLENRLLKRYLDRPELLDLAYDLVRQCREEA